MHYELCFCLFFSFSVLHLFCRHSNGNTRIRCLHCSLSSLILLNIKTFGVSYTLLVNALWYLYVLCVSVPILHFVEERSKLLCFPLL